MRRTICALLIAGFGAIALIAAAPSAFATDADACALLPGAEASAVAGDAIDVNASATGLPPGAKPPKGYVGSCQLSGTGGASFAQIQGNGPVLYLPNVTVYTNTAKNWKAQTVSAKAVGNVAKVSVPGAAAAETSIKTTGGCANAIYLRQGKYVAAITVLKYFDKTGCVDLTPQLTGFAAIAAKHM